jgi:2-keto-4-pentenoate hydratase/2-oxohepta-3-ene-1,7-dioic acid hydratase in catechol pathway
MTLWVRCRHADQELYGVLDGVLEGGRIALHRGAPWDNPVPIGESIPAENAALLAPVQPLNFIGLWNNFHAAAAKHGYSIPDSPLIFLKSPSSIVGPEADIVKPPSYEGRTLFEGELGIVVGRRLRHADEAEAEAGIFGFTCVNDVTAIDLLHADESFPQWARAKGCETFGPVGPAIATGLDWRGLSVRTLVGGRERQNYPVSDMIFAPPAILSLISREITLLPGDLISCGTSLGALPMRPGTVVEIVIDGIGVLRNTFSASIGAA